MSNLDVMDAKRIAAKYRRDNLYLVLSYDENGRPYNLDVSISGEVINHDQITLSNIDAMAVLTSLALREYDALYVAGRLLGTARGAETLPAIIADALIEHGSAYEITTQEDDDE
jgi:hypothetical protein